MAKTVSFMLCEFYLNKKFYGSLIRKSPMLSFNLSVFHIYIIILNGFYHLLSRVEETEAKEVNFPSQFSSVTQSCPTLCDPMDYSTPGLPVHHQLPEFTQTLVHRVGDAIQPSHPLSSLLLPPSIFPSIRVFSN